MPISSTCQSSKATAECNIKIGSRIHVAYLLRPTEVARQHVSVTLKLAASFMLPCYFGGWLSAAVNPLKKHNTIIADSCLRQVRFAGSRSLFSPPPCGEGLGVGGAPLRTPAHASQREEPAHYAHQYGHGVLGLLGEHVMAGVVRHTSRLRFVCLAAV